MTTDSPDTPMPGCPLTTKRRVMAQISLCLGCCCGKTERGRPQVPVDRMKHEWRARGLSKIIQLSVSGCLGPCDVVNVARISCVDKDIWLGNLRTVDDYLDLAEWAEESKSAGRPMPLFPRMKEKRFTPFIPADRESAKSISQII